GMIPKLSRFFDTNTASAEKEFYKKLNNALFDGDLTKNIFLNIIFQVTHEKNFSNRGSRISWLFFM
ncbi:MAG: hypothetical protein ACPGJO_07750, partial [bacterium]